MLATWCHDWTTGRRDLRADRRHLVAPYRADALLGRYAALLADVRA